MYENTLYSIKKLNTPSALDEALKGRFWQFPWQASVEVGFRMLDKSKPISLFTELERLFPLSLDCLVPADTGSQPVFSRIKRLLRQEKKIKIKN
jgi:hypothetical protein